MLFWGAGLPRFGGLGGLFTFQAEIRPAAFLTPRPYRELGGDDKFVGKTSFVSLVSKLSPQNFLRNLGVFLLLVHPPCPSTVRDDDNAALVQCFLAIRQEGGPMDNASISLAKFSHN